MFLFGLVFFISLPKITKQKEYIAREIAREREKERKKHLYKQWPEIKTTQIALHIAMMLMAITMMSTITKAIGGPTSKHFSLPHFSMFICCWCCRCWCHCCRSFTLPKRKKILFDCQAKAYYSCRFWFPRNRRNTQDNIAQHNTTHYEDYYVCIRWSFVFTTAFELNFYGTHTHTHTPSETCVACA